MPQTASLPSYHRSTHSDLSKTDSTLSKYHPTRTTHKQPHDTHSRRNAPAPPQMYRKYLGCDRLLKKTLRENPRSPWESRNQRNSGDQAFDCMEDVQTAQKSDARAHARAQFRPSPASICIPRACARAMLVGWSAKRTMRSCRLPLLRSATRAMLSVWIGSRRWPIGAGHCGHRHTAPAGRRGPQRRTLPPEPDDLDEPPGLEEPGFEEEDLEELGLDLPRRSSSSSEY